MNILVEAGSYESLPCMNSFLQGDWYSRGMTMRNMILPLLGILISIAFVAQPIAVCLAQYPGSEIENAMKGHHLYNLFGNDLGKIQGVTFDESGQPAYILVSVIGSKVVPVPFSALVPASSINRFVVDLRRRDVLHAPGYSINALPLNGF
jgi:hypothetical protein